MKIYDCILYNGEYEILNLRIQLLHKWVDKFIIVESSETFSGLPKELHFQKEIESFSSYLNQIEYYPVSIPECNSAWEREHYSRNTLKVIRDYEDNDLLIISDADEIVNLEYLLDNYEFPKPSRIELKTFYNFFNLSSNELCQTTLIAPYKYLRDINIGDRNKYKTIFPHLIKDKKGKNGGHFTYMFGWNVERYIEKIKSFSHEELKTPYFTNPSRIKKCLLYNFDLYDRFQFQYKVIDLNDCFPQLYHLIHSEDHLRDHFKSLNIHLVLSLFTRLFDPYFWYVKKTRFRVWGSRHKQKLKRILKNWKQR